MLRRNWLLAGIHQQKTACAVGIFGFAAIEARLPHESGLLVAQDSCYSNSGERAVSYVSVDFATRADARQNLFRYVKSLQQLPVPVERCQVHELRSAGIGDIGDVAAGELPQQVR